MTASHRINSLFSKVIGVSLPALAVFALTGACLAPLHLLAAPRLPTDPAEVLERLPIRPGDATARELAGLRAAVIRAAKEAPADSLPAAQLAGRYYELAVARGDPRYIGYADAVLAPFARDRTPAVLTSPLPSRATRNLPRPTPGAALSSWSRPITRRQSPNAMPCWRWTAPRFTEAASGWCSPMVAGWKPDSLPCSVPWMRPVT
jgi:hypothetical protein